MTITKQKQAVNLSGLDIVVLYTEYAIYIRDRKK